jgi:indolepyruvate ferredoxin oxidoreductase
VARLLTDPAFERELAETFEGEGKLSFHLAPPLIAQNDPDLGRPRKRRFGQGLQVPLRMLAKLKRLRGTAFDIFGRTEERRRERALIATYAAMMDEIALSLTAENRSAAIMLAAAPDAVRGFGPVKLAAMDKFDTQWPLLQARYWDARLSPPSATVAQQQRQPAPQH